MVSRKSRRWLVAGTYFILALVCVSIALPWTHAYVPIVLTFVLLYSVGWSSRLFHSVVVGPTEPPPHLRTVLGLIRKRRPDDPDERDIAVRNAAHYKAYYIIAAYSLFACLYLVVLGMNRIPLLVFLPVGMFGPTLPQAVILWTEDDLPEEARI